MKQSLRMSKAIQSISDVRGKQLTMNDRCRKAQHLAALMLEEAQSIQTPAEKHHAELLSKMMQDPTGKVFTATMTDQCFRSENPERVADKLINTLNKFGVPKFLDYAKKIQLFLFKLFGRWFPNILVPIVKHAVRKETASVILPGEHDELIHHMEKRREEGVRINLNHLGEAILGESEAMKRLNIYLNDLSQKEIEYISVKISTICSQINLLAWQDTLDIIVSRLKQLYRAAEKHKYIKPDGSEIQKFVNLDMEEYRDLHLTVEAFCKSLDDPEFHGHSAGIVLQCYLPDSYQMQQQLTSWAKERVAQGRAPIKIRIVKGANLAMERVESSIRGWPQAPFTSKADVDANFKRMLVYGFRSENASAANLGVGSHNLFDIAFALLLRSENAVERFVCFEMLEGMADNMRRVVQFLAGDMLLYCPAATKEEFQNAVAYLVRRLDENTAPENFLRYIFGLKPNSAAWRYQADLFSRSCENIDSISFEPNRKQNRKETPERLSIDSSFKNEPDTDWSLPHNRHWAEDIAKMWSNRIHEDIPLVVNGQQIFTKNNFGIGEDPSYPEQTLYRYSLADKNHIDLALSVSKKAENKWAISTVKERFKLLEQIAQGLRLKRADLIGVMMADTGKVVAEADVEISEAIDFAEYYSRNFEELSMLKDIQWRPKGTVLVAPPWNFPCSIPAGGILAALVTGNCVIFKPAREAVLVGWELVKIFWEAGIEKDILQFITCADDPEGSFLVKDNRINAVILTGATDTAKLLMKLRSDLDLLAETGGKNAMILTGLCDRDLAIKDLVQSAFGHAGQKCSACSLAICEAEVYDDPHFLKQLKDAAASLHVGSPWDLASKVNPLIHAPNETLLRGLTILDPGEEWLLEPKQDKNNANLWSPGIKMGVKEGSFTHQNELFGPVLAVMRADNLQHAVKLANGTRYGLTSGLHSLDEREHDYWIKHIESGNCYINRGITGAIVQRQPFGGCKESSFGPGIKAGGPNYLINLMNAAQIALPDDTLSINSLEKRIKTLTDYLLLHKANRHIWEISIGSYAFFWHHYFNKKHDPSKILGQDNLLSYVPNPIVFRIQQKDNLLDVLRVIGAALICGNSLQLSSDSAFTQELRHSINMEWIIENEQRFMERLDQGKIKRVRFVSAPNDPLRRALAMAGCSVIESPVMANGRLELLHYLREVSLSYDYHRYGYLGERENGTPGDR